MDRPLPRSLTGLTAIVTALATALVVVLAVAPADAAGSAWVEKAQRRLNHLGCSAGPADGDLGPWTRSAVVRFQSRTGKAQTGRLDPPTRRRLYADAAPRCDRRPVPARSGTGRRIVISQQQNWVWLVGPKGGVRAQGGIVDNPSVLHRGSYGTGSYCGRAARIKRNSTSSGEVWLWNFVRFAPCGIGFHRIPTYQSNGAQMHPNWYLGTNRAESHGCIRLSRAMSLEVWRFTTRHTRVRVV
ncbi:L,D-transpeptidase family protein [Nocardioides sp. MAHUQ-72]|uniref:L,D-transpeptidase family protein n=1 Tax=unclassified Nocardioides TaxID=2615069 RepID=UPI00361901E4